MKTGVSDRATTQRCTFDRGGNIQVKGKPDMRMKVCAAQSQRKNGKELWAKDMGGHCLVRQEANQSAWE